ncbi:hypothetical protein T492DRAFT_441058 [Pavlovales sp. CCMP2436]|nr:hypothetical protein T492DRAFT_441058 [Pavlovales sp. CCMP2436]
MYMYVYVYVYVYNRALNASPFKAPVGGVWALCATLCVCVCVGCLLGAACPPPPLFFAHGCMPPPLVFACVLLRVVLDVHTHMRTIPFFLCWCCCICTLHFLGVC